MMGSHKVAGKCYVNTKNSTYHTKHLNTWPNSSASDVVNYSQLSACQEDIEPIKDHPSTHRYLTGLRNKPQQKQPG